MRLRSYLILVAAAGLVPGFVAALFAVEHVREGERQAALRGLHETVRATALLVDREIKGSLSTLDVLGTSQHLQTVDWQAFYAQAAAVDRSPDVWTLLLDATGERLVDTGRPFGAPHLAVVDQATVAQVLATQRPLVTDLTRGALPGELLNTVYVPARAASGYVVAHRVSVGLWQKKPSCCPTAGLPGYWPLSIDAAISSPAANRPRSCWGARPDQNWLPLPLRRRTA